MNFQPGLQGRGEGPPAVVAVPPAGLPAAYQGGTPIRGVSYQGATSNVGSFYFRTTT